MPNIDVAFFSYPGHENLLDYGLRSVRANFPYQGQLFLVWDDNVKAQPDNLAELQIKYQVTFIPHSQLTGWPWPESIVKWGWVKQQIAKMLCYTYSTAEYIWMCDGDVILTGDPELFANNGKPYLRYNQDIPIQREFSWGYYAFLEKYFGITEPHPCTWVGSTCLFNNRIIKEIVERCDLIESVDRALLDSTNRWPFSEFETYGNYCYHFKQEQFEVAEANWNFYVFNPNTSSPIQIMWHLVKQGENEPATIAGDLDGVFYSLTKGV
jgi:hypothetical protein